MNRLSLFSTFLHLQTVIKNYFFNKQELITGLTIGFLKKNPGFRSSTSFLILFSKKLSFRLCKIIEKILYFYLNVYYVKPSLKLYKKILLLEFL